jgi:hypothetical protein
MADSDEDIVYARCMDFEACEWVELNPPDVGRPGVDCFHVSKVDVWGIPFHVTTVTFLDVPLAFQQEGRDLCIVVGPELCLPTRPDTTPGIKIQLGKGDWSKMPTPRSCPEENLESALEAWRSLRDFPLSSCFEANSDDAADSEDDRDYSYMCLSIRWTVPGFGCPPFSRVMQLPSPMPEDKESNTRACCVEVKGTRAFFNDIVLAMAALSGDEVLSVGQDDLAGCVYSFKGVDSRDYIYRCQEAHVPLDFSYTRLHEERVDDLEAVLDLQVSILGDPDMTSSLTPWRYVVVQSPHTDVPHKIWNRATWYSLDM